MGTAALITGPSFTVDKIMEIHDAALSKGEITMINPEGGYKPLGNIMFIVFERVRDEICPADGTDIFGRSLNFGEDKRSQPVLSLSRDRQDLLISSPFPLRLPRVRNPQCPKDIVRSFSRKDAKGNDENVVETIEPPNAWLTQKYEDRSDRLLQDSQGHVTNWRVFTPIADIWLDPFDDSGFAGQGGMGIHFEPDHLGIRASLLVDQTDGRGHIYGGRWEFETRSH